MNGQHNRVPTTELKDLFDLAGTDQRLVVNGGFFALAATDMPVLLPHEGLVLAAIARSLAAEICVEFGTATGKSTYALSANAPDHAKVFTVDLSAEDWDDYTRQCMQGAPRLGEAYRDTPEAAKIVEIARRKHEVLPNELLAYRDRCGLVLIDGDHTYSGVQSDTMAAFELVTDDGVLLWHDFYPMTGFETFGVTHYLNDLMEDPAWVLRHIAGTYFVAGCKAWSRNLPGEVYDFGSGAGPFSDRIVRLAAMNRNDAR